MQYSPYKSLLGFNALCILLLGIVLNEPRAFLFCTNRCFQILNYLDGTSDAKRLNAYAGTPNEEFFQPLTKDDISIYHDIPVTSGKIPSAFEDGILFRTGSNQRFPARSAIHVFEGDAMVHAVKFNPINNTISLTSAFMETPKMKMEMQYNQGISSTGVEELFMAINRDIMELSPFQRIVKMLKFFLGIFIDGSWISPFDLHKLNDEGNVAMTNCANTDILHWNDRLFATCEGSAFFEFNFDADLMVMDSVGFTNLNASWGDYPFLAHCKVDQFNNDTLLVVGNDFAHKENVARIGMIDREHNMLNQMDVELNNAQMMHDMSSTEHFIIIFDMNLWFEISPETLEKGKVFRFVNDSVSKSRIGIIDKQAFAKGNGGQNSDKVQWFEVDSCMVFHMANAWEEGDEIVLVGPRHVGFQMNSMLHHDVHKNAAIVYEWRLNLKTGNVVESERGISHEIEAEMPQIHPLFEGKKSKYMWFSLINYDDEGFSANSHGIIKYDVEKKEIVGKIEYDHDGRFGSYEAHFVPVEKDDIDQVEEEDDGYLVNIIWNKVTKKSNIQIFDAKSMDSEPVAYIQLPYRIPGGFHTAFVYPSM